MCGIESQTAMRTGWSFPERVLLRAREGDGGELGPDAVVGRDAHESSGAWKLAVDGPPGARFSLLLETDAAFEDEHEEFFRRGAPDDKG